MRVGKIEVDHGQLGWAWHAIGTNGKKLGWTGERNVKFAHIMDALVAVVDPHSRAIPVFVTDRDGVRKNYTTSEQWFLDGDCWTRRSISKAVKSAKSTRGKRDGGRVASRKSASTKGSTWRTKRAA